MQDVAIKLVLSNCDAFVSKAEPRSTQVIMVKECPRIAQESINIKWGKQLVVRLYLVACGDVEHAHSILTQLGSSHCHSVC